MQTAILAYPHLADKNLRAWADSWISKAGVNEIEPIVTSDGTRFTVSLRQTVPRHGDPVLHEQAIDVAVYTVGEDGKLKKKQVIEDVRISDR